MIDKGRLYAVTDAIVAVAATIMVLQLKIPDKVTIGAIMDQSHTLIAYIISFLQIFLAWHEHHDSLATAKIINHRIFLINCLWLFFITLLPFATGVMGNSPDHVPSTLIYIAVLLCIQLTISWESRCICKLNDSVILDEPVIKKIRIISLVGYALAAVCALAKPFVGLMIIMLLTVVEIIMIVMYDRKIGKMI